MREEKDVQEEELLESASEELSEDGLLLKKSLPKRVWNLLCLPVLIFLVVFALFQTVIFHGHVPSSSMETTIPAKSFLVGDRISAVWKKDSIKRYDVIVFLAKKGNGETVHMVKRVIALPGDKVEMTPDAIFINGEKAEDEFVSSVDTEQRRDIFTVPENSFFVCGDNRANSNDSRKWKNRFVDRKSIVAKVIFDYRFWDISFMKHYEDNIPEK